MKSRSIVIYYLLLLIVHSSCTSNKHECTEPLESYNKDRAVMVKWEEFKTDYLLSYPECLIIDDDNIIIRDAHAKERLFHVIDLNDGSIIDEFAKQGKGPDEFNSSTMNVCWDSVLKELTFFDPNGRRIHTFSKENGFYIHKKSETIRLEESVRDIIKGKNSYIATGERGRFKDNRFMVLSNDYKITNLSGVYPSVKELLAKSETDYRQMIYSTSFLKVSPNKKNAVFATYKGALLQFFDISECQDSIKIIKSFQLNYPINKEQRNKNHDGWVYGFEDIYATDNFIYAIYNGQTAMDNPMLGRHILIYNWDGELYKSYELDVYLRCIAVDEKTGCAYVAACKEGTDFFIARIKLF